MPVQQGRRVKTDRRDAVKLAHFLRSGDLVEVSVPAAQNEAMRNLERAREDAVKAQRVARHQLSKFLLRHGRVWSGATRWTTAHERWIQQQEFAEEAHRRVRNDYQLAVAQATERINRLTRDIEDLVEHWVLGPLVKALQALARRATRDRRRAGR